MCLLSLLTIMFLFFCFCPHPPNLYLILGTRPTLYHVFVSPSGIGLRVYQVGVIMFPFT